MIRIIRAFSNAQTKRFYVTPHILSLIVSFILCLLTILKSLIPTLKFNNYAIKFAFIFHLIFKLGVYCVYLSEIRDKQIRISKLFLTATVLVRLACIACIYSFLHFFLCLFAIATIQLYIFSTDKVSVCYISIEKKKKSD